MSVVPWKEGLVLAVALGALAGCREEKKAEAAPPSAAPVAKAAPQVSAKVEIPELAIRAGGTSKVRVVWSQPEGTAVNEEAPFRVRWNRSDGIASPPEDVRGTGSRAKEGFTVDVTPTAGAPNAVLTGEIDLVVCDVKTHAVCLPVKRSLELGFVVVKDGPGEAKVTVPLPQAKGG